MPDDRTDSLAALLARGADGLVPAFVEHLEGPWHRREVGHTAAEEPGPGTEGVELYDFDDPGLTQAAMAAMMLGQPLILAGEPGVGKTQFATALAGRLGLAMQPTFNVKSSSAGLDLFYVFDDVARFRDAVGVGASRLVDSAPARDGGGPDVGAEPAPRKGVGALRDYVRFNALGRAILWSAGPDCVVQRGELPLEEVAGPQYAGRTEIALGELFPGGFRARGRRRERRLTSAERSVALVDELDKAPTDAPNDVLGEIEQMSFRIAELDIIVSADPRRWPILFITSNSERSLPDAFLRRCVFHWIEFPEPARLARIVAAHCTRVRGSALAPQSELLTSCVDLFAAIRAVSANKPPATAELVAFVLTMLEMGFQPDDPIPFDDESVGRALGILLKTRVDFDRVREELGTGP